MSDATEQRAAASVPDEQAPTLPPPAVVAPPAKGRPFPPVACAFCAVCALVFLAISLSGTSSWEDAATWGYLPAERIWAGAYWALVTSAFVHVELWHVAFNVYWLWVLGGVVEWAAGGRWFIGLVLTSAFVSSAAQLGASGSTGHGASGVVYALFGLIWAARSRVPAFAAVLGEQTAPLFWIWLVGCIIATQAGAANVGNAAHVAGLILGIFVAQWWFPSGRMRRVAVAGTSVLVALSIVPLFWVPWSPTWMAHKAYEAHLAGRYDAAISWYRKSLDFGGDRPWALGNLALAYQAKGATRESEAALAELRTLDAAAAAAIERDLAKQKRPPEALK